ncbi:MAG: PQQ-like beta-propeller repeat protein [Proteobacteria bacterium]|nr:PQQ-like beta-propeller repeat protein [Pseudomonadota bacterium]
MLAANQPQRSGELPNLLDLISSLSALAEGTRRKALVALARTPAEYAFVRRGDKVLVSHYETGGCPEVFFLDREIDLGELLAACVECALRSVPAFEQCPDARALHSLAERAGPQRVRHDDGPTPRVVRRAGGVQQNPGDNVPLAFGFSASLSVLADTGCGAHAFSDTHALLFDGELWGYSRGRRMALARGPILLPVQRMVQLVSALSNARQAGRSAHVRLRSGSFAVGARMDGQGELALTLGLGSNATFTLPALDLPAMGLPILRVASDLARMLMAADRGQARNLRLIELRNQVRSLRRTLRRRQRGRSFQNNDAERLRLASLGVPRGDQEAPEESASQHSAPRWAKGPRYTERWAAEIDSLDTASTFLCGDRIVAATSRRTLAMTTARAELIWSEPTPKCVTRMAGTALLRFLSNGAVEICDVSDGGIVAKVELGSAPSPHPLCMFAGGGQLPPLALLSDGPQRVVAVDLRTGETRWMFQARGRGPLRVQRAGRVAVIASGESSLHALDISCGEVVWRLSGQGRFRLTPSVHAERVYAVADHPNAPTSMLHALDLFSGRELWTRRLGANPATEPLATPNAVAVALEGSRRGRFVGFDPIGGRQLWSCADPGVSGGTSVMAVDRMLISNASTGRVSAFDLRAGEPLWQQQLGNALADDVPRQLEPVLRNGCLFVPASQVHLLRPADGRLLAAVTACELIPDWMRVDSRGWLYVAEDSGHIRAYAPAPHLRLVT